jgi:hypothetical protein
MADEHGHVSGEASVPAEPGVGTRSPGVSRDSVVAVPSRICVDVVRLRWWPPAAHAATMRLEQSHAAGPFAPKMSGFPRSPMRTSLRPLLPATHLRGDLANGQTVSIDPLNLLAVDAHANRAKGDGDTATWLSPYKPFRCTYVARQIAVKGKYELWLTAAERDAMTPVVGICPTLACPGPALHRLWRNHPGTNRIARPRSNLRPPLRRRQVASPTGTALRLVRRCCPNYARATWLLTQSRPRRRRYRLRMTQDRQDAVMPSFARRSDHQLRPNGGTTTGRIRARIHARGTIRCPVTDRQLGITDSPRDPNVRSPKAVPWSGACVASGDSGWPRCASLSGFMIERTVGSRVSV